jgi:hypothetical protein
MTNPGIEVDDALAIQNRQLTTCTSPAALRRRSSMQQPPSACVSPALSNFTQQVDRARSKEKGSSAWGGTPFPPNEKPAAVVPSVWVLRHALGMADRCRSIPFAGSSQTRLFPRRNLDIRKKEYLCHGKALGIQP